MSYLISSQYVKLAELFQEYKQLDNILSSLREDLVDLDKEKQKIELRMVDVKEKHFLKRMEIDQIIKDSEEKQ